MKLRATRTGRNGRQPHDGFTLLQAIIVMAVAMIVSGATIMSIRASRPAIQLSNSAHQLAGYLERARADSVRRRAAPGSESGVQILDNRTYRVTMGFGGSGTLTSRDFTLEGPVVFTTDPITISFDWRGRPTTGTEATLALWNGSDPPVQVDVTGSGDVTVGSEIFQDEAIPNINLNQNLGSNADVSPDPVSGPDATPTPTPTPGSDHDPTPTPDPGADDATPTPTATPHGNPNATPTPTATASPTPHGNPNATPTPTATPTPDSDPTPAGCAPSVTPSSMSISKNGGSSGVTLVLGSIGGSVTASGPANLTISPSSTTIATGSSGNFTIRSNDNTRGNFTVTFRTPCGTSTVTVTVTN